MNVDFPTADWPAKAKNFPLTFSLNCLEPLPVKASISMMSASISF